MTRFTSTPSSVSSPLVEHDTARRRRTERRTSWSKQKRKPAIDSVRVCSEKLKSGVIFLDKIFLPEKSRKVSEIDVEKSACDMEKVLLGEKSVCSNFTCDVTTSLARKAGIDAVRSFTSSRDVSKCMEGSPVSRGRRNRKTAVSPLSNGKKNSFDTDGDCLVNGDCTTATKTEELHQIDRQHCSLQLILTDSTANGDTTDADEDATKYPNTKTVSSPCSNIDCAADQRSTYHDRRISRQRSSDSTEDSEAVPIRQTQETSDGTSESRGNESADGQDSSDASSRLDGGGLLLPHYEKSKLSAVNIVSKKRCRRPPQSYSPSNQTQVKNCSVTKRRNLLLDICGTDEASPSDDDRISTLSNQLTSKIWKTKAKPGRPKHSHKVDADQEKCASPTVIERVVQSTPSQNTAVKRPKEKTHNIVYVLGGRQANTGQRQLLVQFENGTSNWLDYERAHEQLDSTIPALCKYFSQSEQDISVVNRLPVAWHCTKAASPCGGVGPVQSTSDVAEDVSTSLCRDDGADAAAAESPDNNDDGANKKTAADDQNGRRLVNTRNKELSVVQGDYVHITVRHADRRTKHISTDTCRELIEHLEAYSLDDTSVVVVSGCEDYFSSPKDLDNLLKVTTSKDKHTRNEDVDVLRYLAQTIKHFPKPILASVKHPGIGLAALILSMFDMVFDENSKNGSSTSSDDTSRLPCLFPKLMGLSCKNECTLMGDQPRTYLTSQLKTVEDAFKERTFSHDLDTTLEQMQSHSERPVPSRRGRKKGGGTSEAAPMKTAIVCNSTIDRDTEVVESLRADIEHEKGLARACFDELSVFWKELMLTDPS